jgi:wyosine [tRNA(Phe)-imidazoG37] synthetase (radical SAM superfamily)
MDRLSTVYGPVPSWRLGRSLGIDVVLPPKKCTFNCVYCQLGNTRVHVSAPEMLTETLVNAGQVVNDLDDVLGRLDLGTVDVVTFSGTGEPTLNLMLGDTARKVKKKVGGLPLAILTNSSLFHREDVRRNLAWFDVIVAKLDAGDNETFRAINRPADERLIIETIIDSIKKLRKEAKGFVALEVMLLHSKSGHISNIEGKCFQNLLDAIVEISPDQVQLEVPCRPPSESYVKPPPQRKIKLGASELSKALGEDKLWVYGLHDKRGRSIAWLSHENLEKELVELLKRRPCCIHDISASLGITPLMTRRLLKRLREMHFVATETSEGERYYSYKNAASR